MDEKLIEKHMKLLKVSREEAIQLIKDDKEIDKGAKMFELSPELAAAAKKARQAERKQTGPVKREKKENPIKVTLIQTLVAALEKGGFIKDDSLDILNSEREFVFICDGTKYKVTLACPRK